VGVALPRWQVFVPDGLHARILAHAHVSGNVPIEAASDKKAK